MTFRPKLARYDTILSDQIMPIPVISKETLTTIRAHTVPVPINSITFDFASMVSFPPNPPIPLPTTILQYPTQTPQPIGTIMFTLLSTPPTGYMVCNGLTVLRTEYSALFAAIGITYGRGLDDGLTFNVPNISNQYNPAILYIVRYA
jgi:hypothetical protein